MAASTSPVSPSTAPAQRALASRVWRMVKGLLQWFFMLVITLLGLLAITFFIGRMVPIDPVLAVVGDRATPDIYNAAREAMGLDKPLWQQFAIYVRDVLHGNLGTSILTSNLVWTDITRVFPATLELATLSTILGMLIGVPLGVAAAVYHNRLPDHIARFIGLIGSSLPVFWIGMMGLLLFYAKLGWLPGPGRVDPVYDGMVDEVTGSLLIDAVIAGDWDVFGNAFSHIILPTLILSYFSVAYLSRMTRAFMLDQLSQEYIITARAKGVPEWRVIWGHAFRNIAVPLLTVIALTYSHLLEGSVFTEIVFSWPGIGSYLTNALMNADMNAILGSTLVIGAIFVVINLLTDVLYAVFDPRARRKT
ncbi:MAG: ABC transporter permease [Comamonas sp.]